MDKRGQMAAFPWRRTRLAKCEPQVMRIFSLLFDSLWRQNGDRFSEARQNRQYDSMPEQVMATRKEVLHLQGELDRLSQDLAQTLTLNRVLVKLMVTEGVCTAERLEQLLEETLAQSKVELGENESPSRFCENCGRPLSHPGRSCPYCTELSLPEPSPVEAEALVEVTPSESPRSAPTSEVEATPEVVSETALEAEPEEAIGSEEVAEIIETTDAGSSDEDSDSASKKKKRRRSSKEK